MITILVIGQLQLRTTFSHPDGVRLRAGFHCIFNLFVPDCGRWLSDQTIEWLLSYLQVSSRLSPSRRRTASLSGRIHQVRTVRQKLSLGNIPFHLDTIWVHVGHRKVNTRWNKGITNNWTVRYSTMTNIFINLLTGSFADHFQICLLADLKECKR